MSPTARAVDFSVLSSSRAIRLRPLLPPDRNPPRPCPFSKINTSYIQMNFLLSVDAALPRVAGLRAFSSSPSSSMPRFAPKNYGLLPKGTHKPKKPKMADSHDDREQAPPAWFIPRSSTTAATLRPSFLPPAPRTMSTPEGEIPAPPSDLPPALKSLWMHLHTHPLFVQDSVQFINTRRPAPRTIPILNHPPRNGKRSRGFVDMGDGIGGSEIGGWWDWQVVAVVEGRGPGDVRRGEMSVREWVRLSLHFSLFTLEPSS